MTGPAETLVHLDGRTRALVELAAAIATGRESLIEERCRACITAGVPDVWVDELLLQSLLMVGWPRMFAAAAIWRRIGPPQPLVGEDGTDYTRAPEWRARGELLCRTVYGANYERLRGNVRALHPALEAWMITEGYGRTLARPGLALAVRELCVVAQTAVQGAERQLHSHLKGARHAGASPAAITGALEALRPLLGAAEAALADSLWNRIRE
ncbi:MAG TPA: carboxymuconolactone decarboxylase family protein [Gemmatimonadales bacterium]|nr:carboxymuconolactone decarboxylase family protein [Gemmatimonadales bacterium]